MALYTRLICFILIILAFVPEVYGYGSLNAAGGTSASVTGGGSVQGALALNNQEATFQAISRGVMTDFEEDHLIDLDRYSLNSVLSIKEGSIDRFAERTKKAADGTETTMNLQASGSLVDVALSGSRDDIAAGQGARVGSGAISSYLNLAVGSNVLASQDTALMGDEGKLVSISNSRANSMLIEGGFLGSGDLNTELCTIAGDRADTYGATSFNGMQVINNDILKAVSDSELSVSSDGIYEDRKGDLGRFTVTATNALQPSEDEIDYQTAGWRWESNSPIHYKLSTNLIGSSSLGKSYANEISKAANEWDRNTASNIFKGSDFVYGPGVGNVLEFTSYLPTVGAYQGGTGDGKNNYMAFTKEVTGSTIAVAWTWYYNSQYVKGYDGKYYNKAAESDIYFNGNMAWSIATSESTATNAKFDVRTIATHETGHSIGLSDLYDLADKDKIMYGYNNGQVKWYLRSGDKLGLKTLYG